MRKLVYDNRNFFFFGILILGCLLRIYKLGYDDLWYDEIQTIIRANEINQLPVTFGPPLYYFIFHFWNMLCDKSEFLIRFPSFIFSIFSLIGLKKIAQYVWEPKVGIISTLILAFSPFHIWYAQEARHYALSVLLFIYTFYYFLKALKENRNFFWLLFTLFYTLGIYCDYYFFLLLIPESLIIIIKKDRLLFRQWFKYKTLTLFTFLPWVPYFLRNIKFVSDKFWPIHVEFKSLFITLENYTLGYNSIPILFHFSLLLVCLIIGLPLLEFRNNKKTNEGFIFINLFWIIPLLITFLIAQFYNIYFSRVLIIFSIPYYLVLSYAINMALKKKAYILPLLLFFLNLHSLFNYYSRKMPSPLEYHVGTHIKKPVKPLVEFIKDNIKEGDIILHTNVQTDSLFEFYGGDRMASLSYYLVSPRQDYYWRKTFLDYRAQKKCNYEKIVTLNEVDKLQFKRMCLILSSWARDGTLDSNSLFVREYMEKKYKKKFQKWYQGILVVVYENNR